MTCGELVEGLIDYGSGELSPDAHDRFEAHLGWCSCCVEYVKSYQETIRLTKGTFNCRSERLSAHVSDQLVRAMLAASLPTRRC
jgi:anti-sigma factor RsiW